MGLTCTLTEVAGDWVADSVVCSDAPLNMSLKPELSPPGGIPPGPPDGAPGLLRPEVLDALGVLRGVPEEAFPLSVLKVSLTDWSVRSIASMALV